MLTESKIKEIICEYITESSSKLLAMVKAEVPNHGKTDAELEAMIYDLRFASVKR